MNARAFQVLLPPALHKNLRLAALQLDVHASELVREAIVKRLDEIGRAHVVLVKPDGAPPPKGLR